MKNISQKNYDKFIIAIFFLLYTIIAMSLLFKQPFGNPPDEINRYLIPNFIYEHGYLPNGFDPEIKIPGYGFSYAFQPILPYIIQGFAMKFTGLFSQEPTLLLYSARFVNFIFGFLFAFFVLKLSKLLFADKCLSYLFAFLVVFLPESIFVHTYVNTDSCCMLSIAIMLYGIIRGMNDDFSITSCIYLSIGIILCAMSYYNAYGFILSCIFLFITHFISYNKNTPPKLSVNFSPMLKRGLLISVIVLAGILWWFVRSYLLYDGDFLGLKTRDYCASLEAVDYLKPENRVTFSSRGLSVFYMLKNSDFINLSILSFIGIYGPMNITTSIWIYRFYKAMLALGLISCLCFRKKDSGFDKFFHANMIFCILMPIILSIIYSYSTDYQPQGRYILPILIPLAYYCIRGFHKLFERFVSLKIRNIICSILMVLIVATTIITVYFYAFPAYAVVN